MSHTLQFSHRRNVDGTEGLSVFFNGQLMPPLTSDHPNFDRVKEACFDSLVGNDPFDVVDDESGLTAEQFIAMFDAATAVIERFQRLTDRVTVQGGAVLLDGDPVGDGITNHILRFLDEGEDFMPLVKFLENVSANPQPHSRDQLYDWLNTHEFTITDDGFLVGYKGVAEDGEGGYRSISSGREQVLVNDEVHVGRIPNPIGATVEMARGLVQHDPSRGCHVGLHVGTHEYASDFGRVCLEVKVNPRDVVSVPTDCNWAKVRVCRYEVVGVVESKYASAIRFTDLDLDGGHDEDEAYLQVDEPVEGLAIGAIVADEDGNVLEIERSLDEDGDYYVYDEDRDTSYYLHYSAVERVIDAGV
jgi:hypothetical protein